MRISSFGVALLALTSATGTLPAAEIVAQGFSPGNAEAVVVRTIEGSKRDLLVAAYSFTSKPIARALVDARRRGVQVQVVLDKSQEGDRYTAATFLVNQGVPVRINRRYAIMHNKFIVADGDTVETGSFNYTSSAATKNAENVVVIRDASLATSYTKEWRRLWDEADVPRRGMAVPAMTGVPD